MLAALEILQASSFCDDFRGVLKYGTGYWRRMRRLEKWRHERTMK